MIKKLFVLLQYALPQHLISRLIGLLADSRHVQLKNFLIRRFINSYQVDMSLAIIEEPEEYPTFNSFFIRQIKPERRPIDANDHAIVSPVDGCISQIGKANQNILIQAKGSYFDLESLLADVSLAMTFVNGSFVTLYLAPSDYHRVHMPCAGKLIKTIYIPGKLFSVNNTTAEQVPNLYTRNERLVCVFETDFGKIAIILVGALIVGKIKTVWMDEPLRANQIVVDEVEHVELAKGAELGYFAMGSTVIILSEADALAWCADAAQGSHVVYGQPLGLGNAKE